MALKFLGLSALGQAALLAEGQGGFSETVRPNGKEKRSVSLFLCGDVMTGRGIDQVLAHPGDPRIYEPYLRDAREYLALAEAKNGPVPRGVDDAYIWGDAIEELNRAAPDARIINLETAVTARGDPWPQKGIHYRMHPENAGSLKAARIDCCALANNHILDWDRDGLHETLDTLRAAGIRTAGAGRNRIEAEAPAVLDLGPNARVLVLALGSDTSGIPRAWAASENASGLALLPDLSAETARTIAQRVRAVRRAGDIVVVSIHWGDNWGYEIPEAQREFAHALIDAGGADVIHGHSSHHPKAIECHGGRPILYGCGDFVNDYEGISGHEEFRGDLALMYFVTIDATTAAMVALDAVPMRMRRFRLERASEPDARWLAEVMDRECAILGHRVELRPDGRLAMQQR